MSGKNYLAGKIIYSIIQKAFLFLRGLAESIGVIVNNKSEGGYGAHKTR